MRYMGSKNRLAKYILPVMLMERKSNQCWVEPFVGGANMIDKVSGKRIGNDSHYYLIALLVALQDGWVPPTDVSKKMYYDIKGNKENYPDAVVGFVGFLCSFGAKWWGGYAKNNKTGYNYAESGSRMLVKQAKNLKGIEFICGDYLNMIIPPNSFIYCDPPYKNMTAYKDTIDHDVFWQWCRDRAKEGHTVFVSEYVAPADFECVKTVEHKTSLSISGQHKRVEKLFIYKL